MRKNENNGKGKGVRIQEPEFRSIILLLPKSTLGSNGQETVFPPHPLFQMGAEKSDLTKRKPRSAVGANSDPFTGFRPAEFGDISFCQPVKVSPPFPDVPK